MKTIKLEWMGLLVNVGYRGPEDPKKVLYLTGVLETIGTDSTSRANFCIRDNQGIRHVIGYQAVTRMGLA